MAPKPQSQAKAEARAYAASVMASTAPGPLPSIDAPLPDLNGDQAEDIGIWASFNKWLSGLLNRDSEAFADEEAGTIPGKPHPPFSVRQCCNWGNIRTRLMIMAILDIFGSMYGLASANRVRLISPLLNVTGLLFCWILLIGMGITFVGLLGIMQQNARFTRVFFYWSICALFFNFVLSSIDLTTIDKQCDFIWNNFDHSAYAEKDRELFARQCQSYAFVFFSTVMVGIAFARLYYIWVIRTFYISISPDHEQYNNGRRGGYAPVKTGGVIYSGTSVNQQAHDGSDMDYNDYGDE